MAWSWMLSLKRNWLIFIPKTKWTSSGDRQLTLHPSNGMKGKRVAQLVRLRMFKYKLGQIEVDFLLFNINLASSSSTAPQPVESKRMITWFLQYLHNGKVSAREPSKLCFMDLTNFTPSTL